LQVKAYRQQWQPLKLLEINYKSKNKDKINRQLTKNLNLLTKLPAFSKGILDDKILQKMNSTNKSVLVTGGTGFVGIHCILQLRQTREPRNY